MTILFLQQFITALMRFIGVLYRNTHYPLLIPKIMNYLPAGVQLVPQGKYVAESLKDYLLRHPQIEQRCNKNGEAHYLTTENPEKFKEQAQIFLHEPVEVENITLG